MKICLFNLVKRHTRARATAGDCCFLVNDPLDLAQTRGLLRIERDREALKILERSLRWVLRAVEEEFGRCDGSPRFVVMPVDRPCLPRFGGICHRARAFAPRLIPP